MTSNTNRRPKAGSAEIAARMRNTPRRDNPLELAIRRLVHAAGLRYRVDVAPEPHLRRRADLLFRRARVAVFVDGCFWHACPRHGTLPKANRTFWEAKLARNRSRDRDTDRRLRAKGWRVVRVWEHEAADDAAARVLRWVRERA